MKGVFLAIVVMAAVLAAGFLLRGSDERSPASSGRPVTAVAEDGKNPTPRIVLAIKPASSPSTAAPAFAARGSPLIRELAAGPLKPLYDRLSGKTDRTPEENYVLARLLERCADGVGRPVDPRAANPEEARRVFSTAVSEKDPNRSKRLAAYDRTADRGCAGLADIKARPEQVKELIDQAAVGGDPKARARVIHREIWAACCTGGTVTGETLPSVSDEQLAALRDIVRTGDPDAMLVAGSILSSTLGNLVIRAGADERPIDPRAFYNAWTLAACNAGYDCGPSNPVLLQGCARQGNCDARDVEEYLFFYEHSPQQSQLINEYRARLTQAIQTGDWSYFSFVRARPPSGMVFVFGIGPP